MEYFGSQDKEKKFDCRILIESELNSSHFKSFKDGINKKLGTLPEQKKLNKLYYSLTFEPEVKIKDLKDKPQFILLFGFMMKLKLKLYTVNIHQNLNQ